MTTSENVWAACRQLWTAEPRSSCLGFLPLSWTVIASQRRYVSDDSQLYRAGAYPTCFQVILSDLTPGLVCACWLRAEGMQQILP